MGLQMYRDSETLLNCHLWASTKFTISQCSRRYVDFFFVLLVHVEMLFSALDLTLEISKLHSHGLYVAGDIFVCCGVLSECLKR
uniref:Predicted protein n=1 Tax=Hordeum vulgare subsp. vulgare TaxID=112509 RepID=F2DKI9_HORVV|nr:predicted protein [Hordeum vulgare subsp. vulgare]